MAGSRGGAGVQVGIGLPSSTGAPVRELVNLARMAEDLGYDRVWVSESRGNDAISVSAACVAGTHSIGLATGVVSIFSRTPTVIAQSSASLHDISGGRFTLGLGASSKVVTEFWNGISWDQPLSRMRHCVRIVRSLLSGATVSVPGGPYPLRRAALAVHSPQPPPAVVVGALGPQMLRLAGGEADGVLLNLASPHGAASSLRDVAAGSPGRPDVTAAVLVRCLVTNEPADPRNAARRELMGYMTVPAYRESFSRQGWHDVCDWAMKKWDAGERHAAAAGLPQGFLDTYFLIGDAETIWSRLHEYQAGGITEVVVLPFVPGPGTAALQGARHTFTELARARRGSHRPPDERPEAAGGYADGD